jgi:4-amino-4-deoxy-L-arabinose transferase-like glycosyltransferase
VARDDLSMRIRLKRCSFASRFFHRSGWLAAGVSISSFVVYLATLAPDLTNANYGTDGGDLIAAARTLGVPHPSGYPTYTLLAWLASYLPVGSIAYRVNLLSAVCAAAAAGLFFCVVRRVLPSDRYPALVPVLAALTLAFSSLLWSQAVIAEVYALLMLFSVLLVWLLVRWRDEKRDLHLWLVGLTLGLALGNHLTIVFCAPAALVYLWPDRRGWLRFRTLLPSVALFVVGLGVYLYLPIAARHRPPMNWGNPQTWDGFRWVVSARQYQQFVFGLESSEIPGRISEWAELLGDQFGWWGLAIALVGGWGQWQRDRRLALFALTWAFLVGVYAFYYDTTDSHMYLLPALMLMALCWGEGVYLLLGMVRRQREVWQRLALIVVILLPAVSVALHWQAVDPDDDWESRIYFEQVLETVPQGSLIIVRADQPTFALWYAVYAEDMRSDVRVVSGPMLAFIWYREHIRNLYPGLVVNVPRGVNLTWDDLVHDLVASNASLPTYMTDFKEEWRQWFDITKVGESPIYRVGLAESSGQ